MKKFGFLCCAMLCLGAPSHASGNGFSAEAAAKQIEQFLGNSAPRPLSLSPDGAYLAATVPDPEDDRRRYLAILRMSDNKPMYVTGFGKDRTVAHAHWVNGERLVVRMAEFSAAQEKPEETPDLFAVNFDGKSGKMIFGPRADDAVFTHVKRAKAEYASYAWLGRIAGDDKHVLIAKYSWLSSAEGMPFPEVVKLNVYTGKQTDLGRGPAPGASLVADADGNVRFGYAALPNRSTAIYSRADDGSWTQLSVTPPGAGSVSPFAFHPDGKRVYAMVDDDASTQGLALLDPQTGERELLYRHPEVDVSDVLMSRDRKTLLAVSAMPGAEVRHYVTPDHPEARLLRGLEQAYKGFAVNLISVTDDGKQGIVHIGNDQAPGEYQLVNLETRKSRFMMESRPALAPIELPARVPVQFKARDGLALNGYLSKPRNSKAAGPALLYVHGGPHGVRDAAGFDPAAQLFAHQGYAVLQVNYRGSGGYGREFQNAGFRHWGTTMQDDLVDAVDYLVKEGIADPKRICIVGHSYGGYAALRGVTRDPDLFKCAVGSMGVYDLRLMFEKGDIRRNVRGRNYLKDALGEDMDELARRSPVTGVANIKAALLISHGDADERVPLAHADRLREALDKAGKPYQYMEFRNEAHSLSAPATRQKFYGEVLKFLDQHIGSGAAASAP